MWMLFQVREELLEVEKRVAEIDSGKSESAVAEYAQLKQASRSSIEQKHLPLLHHYLKPL